MTQYIGGTQGFYEPGGGGLGGGLTLSQIGGTQAPAGYSTWFSNRKNPGQQSQIFFSPEQEQAFSAYSATDPNYQQWISSLSNAAPGPQANKYVSSDSPAEGASMPQTTQPQEEYLQFQAPDLPGMQQLPGQQQNLLTNFANSPNMSGFMGNWGTQFGQAPGMMGSAQSQIQGLTPTTQTAAGIQSGYSPYIQGIQNLDPNLSGSFNASPELQGLTNNILGVLGGTQSLPFLDPILADIKNQQARQADEAKAALTARGVVNSTPGQEEYNRLRTSQQANLANIGLNAMSQGLQPMLAAQGQLSGQEMGRTQAEIGRQAGQFGQSLQQQQAGAGLYGNAVSQGLGAQNQGFNQGMQQGQALAGLGQALAGTQMGALNQQYGQNLGANQAQQGLLQQIFGQNMAVQNQALQEFMGMNSAQLSMDQARDQRTQQAMASLLSALGQGSPAQGAPYQGTVNGSPSLMSSLFQILATPGFGNSPLGGWLGMGG